MLIDRNQLVLRMRKKGFTFPQIGMAIGVSASRARQIVVRASRLNSRDHEALMALAMARTTVPFFIGATLAVRICNCLAFHGFSLTQTSRMTDNEILSIEGIGKKGLNLIRAAMPAEEVAS